MKIYFIILSVLMGLCHADEVSDAAKLLGDVKTRRKGTLILKRVITARGNKRDDHAAARAVIALGGALRKTDPKKIIALIKPYSEGSVKNLTYPNIEIYSEYSRCIAEGPTKAVALQRQELATERTQGLSKAIAIEGLADCLVLAPNLFRTRLLAWRYLWSTRMAPNKRL